MNPDVTVVSLGPGDPELLNIKTVSTLRSAQTLILRTEHHPLVSWLEHENIHWVSLDHFYDHADDFDEMNRMIADHILQQAAGSRIVYAVADASSDCTVRTLFEKVSDPSQIRVIPGVGFFDGFISGSLSLLPDGPITISTASDLLSAGYCDPNQSLLITELDNPILSGQIKILLTNVLEDDHKVYLIRDFSGSVAIPLYQIDRQKDIDHMTAVLVPGSDFLSRHRFVMRDLVALTEKLRSPGGCPWDRTQTHKSLQPYLVEEAWECVASIDQQDYDHLCEELGDLLFQVVFHASVGDSYDEFTLFDVISGICSKMIRRHPHVFGEEKITDQAGVRIAWEKIKSEETGNMSVISGLNDISEGLPALKYVSKILKKLSSSSAIKRDPKRILSDIAEICQKIGQDPVTADRITLGKLLFLCTELNFRLGVDSELILHRMADRLKDDLRKADNLIKKDGKSFEHLTFEELGVYLDYVEGEIE